MDRQKSRVLSGDRGFVDLLLSTACLWFRMDKLEEVDNVEAEV